MTTIRIHERISTEEVLSWRVLDCSVIRLGRRGSFEPGGQGLALSSLAAINPQSSPLVLACDFDEPQSAEDFDDTPFSSAFGFALVRVVRRIEFNGQVASDSFKVRIGNWYKEKEGILGSGSSTSVVCPDPIFFLPPALAKHSAGEDDSYPAPSAFQALLARLVQRMGFSRLLGSSAESEIIDFVYEALRNSQEHGVTTDPYRRSRSTRALIVEKLVLQGNLANRQLSDELRDYVERIVEGNRNLGLGVVCLTVADQGDGIQTTLPPRIDESDEARLARAFEPGESRKPTGVVKRGQGLPNIVSTAHRLQALVKITSGDLQISQDFSLSDHPYPKIDFDRVRRLAVNRRGTTVSIFFPEFGFDIDQKPLFGR